MVDNLANALFFAPSRDIYNSLLTFLTRDSAEGIYLHRYYLHIVRNTPLELAMIEKATRSKQKKQKNSGCVQLYEKTPQDLFTKPASAATS